MTFSEEVNSWPAASVGLVRPRPPRHVGREKQLDLFFIIMQLSFPVRAGMKWRQMASSSGCKRSEARDGAEEICPLACKAMSGCRVCSMRLGIGYGSKFLN